MPPAANDAFTLGLTHDPSRLGLHSSSPKLPFVTNTKSSPHRTITNRRQSSEGRYMSSQASPDPQLDSHARNVGSPTPQSPSTNDQNNTHGMHAQRVPIDWEIPRKTLHSSIGFLTLWLYTSHGSPRNVVVVLSAGLAFVAPLDVLRLRSAKFERVYERCVGFLMRESEKKNTNGVIWYLLGVIFVLSVYPLDIAVVSIMILSWADTAASTIGRLFGSRTPSLPHRMPILNIPLAPRKSVAGFVAASVTGACIAVGFWGWVVPMCGAPSTWHWFGSGGSIDAAGGWVGLSVLGVVSGVVSGVAEALDLGSLDDNLTLPIISGGCLWGFFKMVELFAT